MKVNYINWHLEDNYARCTFLGHDAAGKRRRPVIDLDASDLARLVEIARAFRRHQRRLAHRHTSRADTITTAGVAE